jgi:4-hydroxythreonine-4-phosphate dehydrogenase
VKRNTIAVTMGDPAGVGPELCLRVLADGKLRKQCRLCVFGDAELLRQVAGATGLPPPPEVLPLAEWERRPKDAECAVIDCGAVRVKDVRPGAVSADCGRAAHGYLRLAAEAAVAGHVDAIATAPLHKEALHAAGIPHAGHTEILAELTGARRVCMMMASKHLTVSLVTIHVPLAIVPRLLSQERILDVIRLTDQAHRRLGREQPHLCVCGLNPHAGEHGLFGREEEDLIRPAVKRALAEGIDVEGPVPPDTAFLKDRRAACEGYIVMYHDQGLIPFKMLSFESGVNITLGLPIVRTSVDHGTAFDIAWQGKASASSLTQAVLWADRMAGGVSGR